LRTSPFWHRQEEWTDVVGVGGDFNSAFVLFAEEGVHQEGSVGGDSSEKGDRDAGHLMLQFLIVIQKQYIGNISRRKGAMITRNDEIREKNRKAQKLFMKLR
jgi:hypothetical protein